MSNENNSSQLVNVATSTIILEHLIIGENRLAQAARAAMEARAYTLSANLNNARRPLLTEIHGLLRGEKELITLLSIEAQTAYRENIGLIQKKNSHDS